MTMNTAPIQGNRESFLIDANSRKMHKKPFHGGNGRLFCSMPCLEPLHCGLIPALLEGRPVFDPYRTKAIQRSQFLPHSPLASFLNCGGKKLGPCVGRGYLLLPGNCLPLGSCLACSPVEVLQHFLLILLLESAAK
jgi:hypothetical protein